MGRDEPLNRRAMIRCVADNIYSPLGTTTLHNFSAVRAGHSALRLYDDRWALPEPLMASLFPADAIEMAFAALFPENADAYSRFEKLAILSIFEASQHTPLSLDSQETVFILSSTKGNVELLDPDNQPHLSRQRVRLGESAQVIARFFGNPNTPIVVSNACISGVHAQILAARLLHTSSYRHAVVCGCDVQSAFIVSGFQSFKALSPQPCRPFDKDRCGLNLGEAAATMILSRSDDPSTEGWTLCTGAVRNDANHISGPSRTGEGSFRALQTVCNGPTNELAFVNVHGTATPYNDEMESIALSRAGLSAVPITGLKGTFGHTMGAAGVLETLLSFRAVEAGIVLPTRGFREMGVSQPVNISAQEVPTRNKELIKLLSGFGGCNAAVRWKLIESPTKNQPTASEEHPLSPVPDARCALILLHRVRITPAGAWVDGTPLPVSATGQTLLSALYKEKVGNYPKFHKMDGLSQLGFLAAELLFAAAEMTPPGHVSEHTTVVLVGRTGSLAADRRYQDTIQRREAYFPSPAVFVYTLPNIVTGEVAIRHRIHGETAFYLLEEKNESHILQLLSTALCDAEASGVMGGWLEYEGAEAFEADLCLYRSASPRPDYNAP